MKFSSEGKKKNTGLPRAANFSSMEKELLTTLVTSYRNVLENKQTDAVTTKVCTDTCMIYLLAASSVKVMAKL